MRRVLIATTAVAGLALLGMSAPSAMPLSGLSTGSTAAVSDQVTKAGWHSRYRSHWRWGSRGGHWRWGSRRW